MNDTKQSPKPTPKAWLGLESSLRVRLLRELEEFAAQPPNLVHCLSERLLADAAHQIGRYSVIVTMKKVLKENGVVD